MTLLVFVLTLFNGIWCCTYQDALYELFENFGFILYRIFKLGSFEI